MKKLSTILVLAMLLVGVTTALASAGQEPTTTEVVMPVLKDPFTGADAAVECAQIGDYMYAYKIDGWAVGMDGVYDAVFPGPTPPAHTNTITISNSNGWKFDWAATNSIGAVIVKSSNAANAYYYDPQVWLDTYLTGVYHKDDNDGNPTYHDISHVTFCWNPDTNGCEWIGETAWAAGTRYVTRGNWATWTSYAGIAKTVDLLAGQTMKAGEVTFSAPVDGWVTITIALDAGWRFEDVGENVKVQDYEFTPPAKNPAPGRFDWKGNASGSEFSIVVPTNNFYGVHVNVEWEKCD